MAFTLTKFIYPLEKAIPFYPDPQYEFDNPRTKEEIDLVVDFISKTFEYERNLKEEKVVSLNFRLTHSITHLVKYLQSNNIDKYAAGYYEANKEKSLLEIIAQTWVIVRFKDNGDFSKIVADRNHLVHLVITRDETSYTSCFKTLSCICHLISLLSNDESEYHGDSFLLTKHPYDLFFKNENHDVHEAIDNFTGMGGIIGAENRGLRWTYWLDGRDAIIKAGSDIYSAYSKPAIRIANKEIKPSQKQTPSEKLLHIGNHLKMANRHLNDPEIMLVLLVGTIEFLLTRNPDTTKFNVEDSISKQFNLKCTTLVHSVDKGYSMDDLSKMLKKIYSKRSDIAHGNYIDDYGTKEVLDMVIMLFQYLNRIIKGYIEDRELVDFLKDS